MEQGAHLENIVPICIAHRWHGKTYRRALKPPNNAPLAIPTQKPIVKPYFIFEKQLGCWFAPPYILPGTAGIFDNFYCRLFC